MNHLFKILYLDLILLKIVFFLKYLNSNLAYPYIYDVNDSKKLKA